MTTNASAVSRLARQLEALPLVIDDAEAHALVGDLRAAGLALAAASVAAGQRQRLRILTDCAADLLALRGRSR